MRLNVNGSIFLYKRWKNDFEENKFIERYGECSVFTSKGPLMLSVERVISYKSGDKKTVRSRVEDSAVDYWAVYVGGTKNNNKHFYTMIKWF